MNDQDQIRLGLKTQEQYDKELAEFVQIIRNSYHQIAVENEVPNEMLRVERECEK